MQTPATVVYPDCAPLPDYVFREALSLRQFVNRYIRTRRRPVNAENRLAVQQAIQCYDGRFPARCRDLESFLDALLLEQPSDA
jgi:hypothetical protein